MKPVKILVYGPPISCKTFLSEQLSEIFNLNKISAKGALDYIRDHESPFLKEIEEKEEELKHLAIEEMEKAKKKPTDAEKENVKVKLPEKMIAECLKLLIEQKNYWIKGFVYDNAIKT